MNYSIKIKSSAKKSLLKIAKLQRLRLIEQIDTLVDNPFKGTQLKGDLTGLRRIRVGQYRVMYEVLNDELIILVVRMAIEKTSIGKESSYASETVTKTV